MLLGLSERAPVDSGVLVSLPVTRVAVFLLSGSCSIGGAPISTVFGIILLAVESSGFAFKSGF